VGQHRLLAEVVELVTRTIITSMFSFSLYNIFG
jgi:hypothetical protein